MSKDSRLQAGFTTPEALVWIVSILLILATVSTGVWSVGRGGERVLDAALSGAELLSTEQLLRREASRVEIPYWSREGPELAGGGLAYYRGRSDRRLVIDQSGEGPLLRAESTDYPLPQASLSLDVHDGGRWPGLRLVIEKEGRATVEIRAPLGGRPNALW